MGSDRGERLIITTVLIVNKDLCFFVCKFFLTFVFFFLWEGHLSDHFYQFFGEDNKVYLRGTGGRLQSQSCIATGGRSECRQHVFSLNSVITTVIAFSFLPFRRGWFLECIFRMKNFRKLLLTEFPRDKTISTTLTVKNTRNECIFLKTTLETSVYL